MRSTRWLCCLPEQPPCWRKWSPSHCCSPPSNTELSRVTGKVAFEAAWQRIYHKSAHQKAEFVWSVATTTRARTCQWSPMQVRILHGARSRGRHAFALPCDTASTVQRDCVEDTSR